MLPLLHYPKSEVKGEKGERTIIAGNEWIKSRFNNNESNNAEQCTHESNIFLTAETLKAFYIDVSNNSDGSSAQQCAHDQNAFLPSETRVYTCPCGMHGRFVRIRYPVIQRANMQLCEVQVQAGGEYHE